MAAERLVPQAFWFRFNLPCRRVAGLPRSGKRPLDLPPACRLIDPGRLDDRESAIEVRAAWDRTGLGLAIHGTGPPPLLDTEPGAGEPAEIWVDTRDTRSIHRASRFCHRFAIALGPGTGANLAVVVTPRPIHRAQADAPRANPSVFVARAARQARAWWLEVFLPAESLNGYDPETNRRLGLQVRVADPARGDWFLGGLGREFPVAEDPSLWPTLELRDEAG